MRRSPGKSALGFYGIATLALAVWFVIMPSWGAGILVGVTALTLAGHLYVFSAARRANASSQTEPAPMLEPIHVPGIGNVTRDADAGLWRTDRIAAFPVLLGGGEAGPDQRLIASVGWLEANHAQLAAQVRSLLDAEVKKFAKHPQTVAEIGALRIASVELPWPARPRDGMIYLAGGDPHRVWRCDLREGTPSGLGFDS